MEKRITNSQLDGHHDFNIENTKYPLIRKFHKCFQSYRIERNFLTWLMEGGYIKSDLGLDLMALYHKIDLKELNKERKQFFKDYHAIGNSKYHPQIHKEKEDDINESSNMSNGAKS